MRRAPTMVVLAAILLVGCTVARKHTLVTYDAPAEHDGWTVHLERFWIHGHQRETAADSFVFTLRIEHPWEAGRDAPRDSFPWDLDLPVGDRRLPPSGMTVRVDPLTFADADGLRLAVVVPDSGVWREGLAYQGRLVHDFPGLKAELPRTVNEFVVTTKVRWLEGDDEAAVLPCRWEFLRVRESYLEPISR